MGFFHFKNTLVFQHFSYNWMYLFAVFHFTTKSSVKYS